MLLPARHFAETKQLAAQLHVEDVEAWLLEKGYYPEQYVLPPCFSATGFKKQQNPYFQITLDGNKHKLRPGISEHIHLSLPKSMLIQRDFALVDPRHYHDMVTYMIEDWPFILGHLFHDDQKIYAYSFPIPLTRKEPGTISSLRAGRMIYEFLEMAEGDLVAEAHKYKFLLRTDIRNFYASIYTHSIPWALQGKANARQDRFNIDSLGKKLDVLAQYSNDQCTNGIAVGPAISDLLSEMLLAAIDLDCSRKLAQKGIDFVGVRFKDDYRFLCRSEDDARTITVSLQQCMQAYNLTLSEEKSYCLKLPEGLFRPWKAHYKNHSLSHRRSISYRVFERTLQSVLQIDVQISGTGIIDRFLSELTNDTYNLKLQLNDKQQRSALSLLLLLRERRAKTFPVILAIVESLLNKYSQNQDLAMHIKNALLTMLQLKAAKPSENEYEILWLVYFLKTVMRRQVDEIPNCLSPLIESVIKEERIFYDDFGDCELFAMPDLPIQTNHLLRHLAMFQRQQQENQGEADN